MKRAVSVIMIVSLISAFCAAITLKAPAAEYGARVNAKSAILMDAATGEVLFEQNSDEALPPASVTKIMTLLLIMEAIDSGKYSLSDEVQISENAASMGGSQVYLAPGETMSVEELIKCIVIASANDAAVALAEYTCGSEESFVKAMNDRAKELGMKNTSFENTTGLDDTVTNHKTSARDIATMSRELLKHTKIKDYTGIWMDTIRNGAFTLTNTNRLIRFYNGATGLKTGSTAKALFCMSATAQRDGLELIAVIMASPTRDERNIEAQKLLNWGFANYASYRNYAGTVENLNVTGSTSERFTGYYNGFCATVPKADIGRVEAARELKDIYAAPIREGEKIGRIVYSLNGKTIGEEDIYAKETVAKIKFTQVLGQIILSLLGADVKN